MTDKEKRIRFTNLHVLGLIWLVGAILDRIWFVLDHAIPAWDQADYLTGSLNYWRALQHPQLLSAEWWTSFWLLSSKIPPLTYIVAAVIQHLFGTSPDQATLIQLIFSAILLVSVYGLGTQLFNPQVGLWATGFCQLMPSLYRYRLDFLLDYPLTAGVTLSFWCLTAWRSTHIPKMQKTWKNGWFWAAAFGLSTGAALMVKQTAVFFLITPALWLVIDALRHYKWRRIAQLILSLLLAVLVSGPWYRTNWLLMLTAGKRATIDSAIAEGDPGLNTLDAWTYYAKILPYQISWPLLLVPTVGLLLYWWKQSVESHSMLQEATQNLSSPKPPHKRGRSKIQDSLTWLAVFLVGAYILCSLNINKDDRYILPYLPGLSVFLAFGFTLWVKRWGSTIRWGTVSLAALLMVFNLFPVGGSLGNHFTQVLSPYFQHPVYTGANWPHPQVIQEIIQTEPYLRSTLAVLPSTAEINQHNFNYYGALKNFQVYGRQVGTREKFLSQDTRSLSWFLTKTGEQGSVPTEAQAAMLQMIGQGAEFQLNKTWKLPDGSLLNLYHRRLPPIQVAPLEATPINLSQKSITTCLGEGARTNSFPPVQGETQGGRCLTSASRQMTQVQLKRVIVPDTAPPGKPVPVTYEWIGSWEELQSGLVLLTWQTNAKNEDNSKPDSFSRPFIKGVSQHPNSKWLHDHGLGMGALQAGVASINPAEGFRLTEQLAMLPPPDTTAGTYTLKATYLNRQTGQTYPIHVPPVTLKIDPATAATPAPELDLVTQLRTLAANLPKGPEALESVFEETGRINQYDPIQDYLVQAQLSLAYRLQQEPQNRSLAYALALSNVLKRNVKGAIYALEQVVQLDFHNPYAYAYLAFVHLYNWQPKAAEASLQPALELNPNLPEIQALRGVAALMQGNFVKAWGVLQKLNIKT